jgi:predicted  nucleic acid-binding Zn-ribbon protein
MERDMNVKRTLYFVLIGIIVMMMGCTSKYSDMIDVNTKFINAMEKYITSTGKADSAKDVAKAINEYSDQMEKLAPQMKKVRDKYPELKNNTDVPEELESLQKKTQGLEQKMTNSFMNMMKYMMDPDVQAAQERLQKAMIKMQ